MTPLDKELGDALNWPHKTIDGDYVHEGPFGWQAFSPSTEWSQCGPLIEEYLITICLNADEWLATDGTITASAATPLIAVCKLLIKALPGEAANDAD